MLGLALLTLLEEGKEGLGVGDLLVETLLIAIGHRRPYFRLPKWVVWFIMLV